MKKVKLTNRNFFNKLEFSLFWGMKGLTISFLILLIAIIILMVFFIALVQDFVKVGEIAFKMPQGSDYLIVFAGFLLFVVVPFLIGIRIGLSFKKPKV